MTMPTFNTLEYVHKLLESGVPRAHAEAQAQALHEALSEGSVTPADLLLVKTDLIARMEMVKHDLEVFKASVSTKFTTLFWLVGLALALQAGQVGALIYIIGRLP